MTRKQKRLTVIGGAMGFLALAAALTFAALGQKTSYFYMPADLEKAVVAPGQRIRLGGLVEDGTVRRGDGTQVSFAVTDKEKSVKVVYTGLLPDLFREGQGVITEGTFGADGVFVADSVLAKHDENYMPKEVAESLKAKGVWKPELKARPAPMVEAGHFALVLAFALALIQSTVPLIGARSRDERMMAVGGPVAVTGFALVAVAFAALTMAYVQSDFSVANVWENSHSLSRCCSRSPEPGATMRARCCCGC